MQSFFEALPAETGMAFVVITHLHPEHESHLAELLPSYWLVQAGKVATGNGLWPLEAWVVMAVWTLALVRLAVRAWQRDTERA